MSDGKLFSALLIHDGESHTSKFSSTKSTNFLMTVLQVAVNLYSTHPPIEDRVQKLKNRRLTQ
jgi:Zn-dependent protease with chaperone function